MRWSLSFVLLAACSGSTSESPIPPASSASQAPIPSHAPSAVVPSASVAQQATPPPPTPSATASVSAAPVDAPNQVPCKTVADCWLDDGGHAIARPKAMRGRPLPKGNCGENLLWLRTVLECKDGVCAAKSIGDMC